MTPASVADASGCSAAMITKSTLPADYQQKVLTGAQELELHSYNEALPLMMVRYMGPGLLGLGITALIAGFMSGMAGNVSAFSTVWTYDIYKPLIKKNGSRQPLCAGGPMVDPHRRRWSPSAPATWCSTRTASWITCRRSSASSSRLCWPPS